MTTRRNPRSLPRMTKRRQKRRTVRLARLFAIVLFAAGLMVLCVWQRVWTHALVQEISQQEKEVSRLRTEIARLQETRDRLADFGRIRREVGERCGLGLHQKYVLPIPPEFRSMVEEDLREIERGPGK